MIGQNTLAPAIFIPDAIIAEVQRLSSQQRQFVEEEKEDRSVDDIMSIALTQHRRMNPGLARFSEEDPNTIKADILNSLDLVIAVFALCENIDDVERVKKVSVLLGRQWEKKAKINEQEIYPKLKAVFAEVASQFKLHDPNDHVLLRRKVRAAITVINDSMNNRRTR